MEYEESQIDGYYISEIRQYLEKTKKSIYIFR